MVTPLKYSVSDSLECFIKAIPNVSDPLPVVEPESFPRNIPALSHQAGGSQFATPNEGVDFACC